MTDLNQNMLSACLATAIVLLIAAGCETSAVPTSSAPRIAPLFDYTPPETADDEVDITLAVVGTSFESPAPLFDQFAKNMSQDFLEALSARGYRVRGPYASYDEMTFPDKEGSDLLLSADFDFKVSLSGLQATGGSDTAVIDAIGAGVGLMGAIFGGGSAAVEAANPDPDFYTFRGSVTVTPRISLVLSESLTQEKMWTKSLNLGTVEVSLEGTNNFEKSQVTLRELLIREDQFYTDLGKQLEEKYREALRMAHQHLDPREVTAVSEAADPLRERKRF